MPFVTERETGFRRRLPIVPDAEDPSIGELMRAGFETENSLGSWAAVGFGGPDFEDDDEFDSLAPENIEGYEDNVDVFIDSRSGEEQNFLKSNIDHEKDNRRLLNDGGGWGVVSMMTAAVLDPILLPLFAVAAPIKAGQVGGTALKWAASAGGLEAIAETAKHSTQELRTPTESVINITGATLITGIMGGLVGKLAKKDFDQLSKELDDYIAPQGRSVGASATDEVTLEESALIPTLTKVENIGIAPGIRSATSEAVSVRQAGEQLADSPFFTIKNLIGKRTSGVEGSAESGIRQWTANLGTVLTKMDTQYKAYRALVRKEGGKSMSRLEFREEVGRAGRRNDKHDNEVIDATAKIFRAELITPLKDAAIKQGLLPEGITTKTALSYLTRVYKHELIHARRTMPDGSGFQDVIFRWMKGELRDRNLDLDDLNARAPLLDDDGVPIEVRASSTEFIDDLTEAEILKAASDTVDNILGTPAGRIPGQVIPELFAKKAGPLQERTLLIPDELIEEFLESDIELIANYYNRTMSGNIEVAKRFGDINMTDTFQRITDEFLILRTEAGKQFEGKALEKRLTQLAKSEREGVRDIEAMRDRLLGSRVLDHNPGAWYAKAGRVARELNYLRLLGGMTISAIPDLARPIMTQGLLPVMRGLQTLAIAPARLKMAAAEVKRMGIGWDMVLDTRAQSIAEIMDVYGRRTMLERGLKGLTAKFGIASLMAPWNAAMKQFSGVIISDSIIRQSAKWTAQTISKNNIKKMAQVGIDEGMAIRITEQIGKHGDIGDVTLPRLDLWDDFEAASAFKSAVGKDVDRTIVTPGVGDRPLFLDSEVGKQFFQFKSFALAANNRVLISGLQQRDMAALSGLMMSVALGSVVYGAKQFTAGREISTDPSVLVKEAIDRSGVLGVFIEANNIVEKASRNKIGLSAMVGGPPMSRFASRNILGALAGPTVGFVEDLNQTVGAVTGGEPTKADARTMMKLVPFNNIFYARWLFRRMAEGGAEAIGITQ